MLDRISNRVSGNFYKAAEPVKGFSSLNCIDLFAGAGGFSLAAMNLGIQVKLALEFNKHACATYKQNLVQAGSPVLRHVDITETDPQQEYLNSFDPEQECHLVLGGPPCQGFSTHRIGGAGVGDPRNSLIHWYFKYVTAFGARAFLMENVPGMLWPRHKDYLDEFYQAADDAGYEVREPITLDARDFGVPQRRKRVFILGTQKSRPLDLVWPMTGTHSNKETNLPEWRKAEDVFQVPVEANDPNDTHMNHTPQLIEVFKSTPLNGGSRRQSNRVLPCHENHSGHKDVYGRINPAEPGPTMTTACINPSKGRFVHPTKHHGITLRQAARFQTFPDNFVFTGGLMAAGQQIGNAVPVLLGEHLLTHIGNAILNST